MQRDLLARSHFEHIARASPNRRRESVPPARSVSAVTRLPSRGWSGQMSTFIISSNGGDIGFGSQCRRSALYADSWTLKSSTMVGT